MKVIKAIVKAIMWVLVLAILLLNVYSFLSIKVFGNKLADFGGYSPLEVISGSMEPTIKVGDMIIINTKTDDYKVNDIVTFIDVNGSFVTHRIIEEMDSGYVTKGDNNDSKDQELVTKNDIVGVYKFKINYLGVFLRSVKSPLTFVIILVIGIILCVLASTDKDGKPLDVDDEYLEFLEYKKKNKKKKKEVIEEIKETTEDIIEVSKETSKTSKDNENNKAKKEKKYYNKNKEDSEEKATSETSTKKTSNSKKKNYNTKKKEEEKVTEVKKDTSKKKTATKKSTKKK